MKCFVRGLTFRRGLLLEGCDVGPRSSCNALADRFLWLSPADFGATGGGHSFGGVLVTAWLALALLPFDTLPGLTLPRSFSPDRHEGHTGGCPNDSSMFDCSFRSSAFARCAKLLSGRVIASGAASAAAWMRFFSKESGVLCLRNGELVRGTSVGVCDRGGSVGLITNDSRAVKMLGLLEEELICDVSSPWRKTWSI